MNLIRENLDKNYFNNFDFKPVSDKIPSTGPDFTRNLNKVVKHKESNLVFQITEIVACKFRGTLLYKLNALNPFFIQTQWIHGSLFSNLSLMEEGKRKTLSSFDGIYEDYVVNEDNVAFIEDAITLNKAWVDISVVKHFINDQYPLTSDPFEILDHLTKTLSLIQDLKCLDIWGNGTKRLKERLIMDKAMLELKMTYERYIKP